MLIVDEIGSQQDATAASLQMLVGAGLLTPDKDLENFERQQMGLPPADPDLQDDNKQQYPLPDPPPAATEPGATPLPALPYKGAVNASGRGKRVTITPEGQITLW
jgi:hypothetical protein